jgi:hypothetical protein
MKNISLFFFLFSFSIVFSQQKFSTQFSFKTDNDLYISTAKDRYYTSGIFLTYRHLTDNKNEKIEKKIFEWQIGHQMYTPFKSIVTDVSLHDRPFAAYLYGSFGINRIYKNNQILKTSLQVGVIGPAAFGKELQDFIHDIYDFDKAVGWKHQIKSAFGINLNASYSKFLVKDETNYFDITWVNNAKLGTVFTNISSGFYARMGFKPLQKIINSIAFDTSINNKKTSYKREGESFLYAKTTLNYVFYDATLQGSFLNTDSEVTKELIPSNFGLELGLKFTLNRFNLGYAYLYNGQESKGLRVNRGNYYGSIQLNYLFY